MVDRLRRRPNKIECTLNKMSRGRGIISHVLRLTLQRYQTTNQPERMRRSSADKKR